MAEANSSLVLEVAREMVRQQLAFADAIEAKVSTLFAAGSTLVGLLAALLALARSRNEPAFAALISVAIVLYAGLTVVWWVGGGPAKWVTGPSVASVRESARSESNEDLVDRLIDSYLEHYRDNECTKKIKALMLRAAFVLVVCETACLAAAAFVTIFA